MKKEKSGKSSLVKRIILIVLILWLMLLIAVAVIIKVFTVETVKIEGNELYEENRIKETVLNDKYSWNSL